MECSTVVCLILILYRECPQHSSFRGQTTMAWLTLWRFQGTQYNGPAVTGRAAKVEKFQGSCSTRTIIEQAHILRLYVQPRSLSAY